MNNQFVEDGFRRFSRGKKALSSESIEKKYAVEMADASPDEKRKIHERMADELEQRKKALSHKPSPGTLW